MTDSKIVNLLDTTNDADDHDNFVLDTIEKQNRSSSLMDAVRMAKDRSTLLLIESSHLWQISKSLNIKVNYVEMLNLFQENFNILRAIYYSTIIDSQKYNPIIRLIDFVSYNGYQENTEYVESSSKDDGKKDRNYVALNTKPRMITDMLSYAYESDVKHVILISGSSQFVYPMKALQKKGVQFTVISSLVDLDQHDNLIKSVKISPELRREADTFLEINDLRNKISD